MLKKYFLLLHVTISACEILIAKYYSDDFIIYLSFLCTDWSPIRHYQIAGPTIPVVLLTTYFEVGFLTYFSFAFCAVSA